MSSEDLDTPELREYRERARAWLRETLTPLAVDQDGTIIPAADTDPTPERIARARVMQSRLFDAGYAGITFPTEYGGAGLDLDHERVFLEEAAKFDSPIRDFGVSLNILGKTLLRFGTEQQKRTHLPKMLRGEELWLQLLSEPSGGSDLAGLITRATRDGDTFLLNGQKTWSTGARFADFAMCPARTNWDVPKHRGLSVFILDLKTPGVEIRDIRQIDGGAEFCEEFLTDVVVSADDLIGTENDGWTVIRGLLEIEHEWVGRTGGSPTGTVDESVDELVALARRRGRHGEADVRRRIAQIREQKIVHRFLVERVGKGLASGTFSHGYGGLLKMGSDLVEQGKAETTLELAGTSGIAWAPGSSDDAVVSKYLRSRRLTIAGGTSEIQRNNVSERALALPREPSVDRDRPFNEVLRS